MNESRSDPGGGAGAALEHDLQLVLGAAQQWYDDPVVWRNVSGPAYFESNLKRAENRRQLGEAIARVRAAGGPPVPARPQPTERLYHEIMCPTLTHSGPCSCQPVIVADHPVDAMRERCASIAETMAVGPWGDAHEAITPGSLVKMIARAIRDTAR